jgi:CHAT domain
VSLLSIVAPRSLIRDDQENILRQITGLASDAAACCVRAGLTDRAVELLEQGRGILLGQALDTRTDLTDLADRHPGLADRFAAVRDVLDLAGESRERRVPPLERQKEAVNVDDAAVRLAVDRQRTAAEELERVIQEIRDQPGFAGFLRSPIIGDLLAAAADGPIVIVNVSRFGSHALILTSSGVLRPVALDDVTPRRVSEQVSGLLSAFKGGAARPAPDRFLTGMLGWLWDAIAGPVLGRLRLTGPPADGQPWPRLWWCPVGPLSFLPLHAAGRHHTRSGGAAQTVMDRAVSSYTPTVRALLHARRGRSGDRGSAENGSTLVVAVPQTADEPYLRGAEAEASMLRQRLDTPVITLSGPQATRTAVIGALPAARRAHFACHGSANLSDPSASCLLLADSQRLTVTDIARLRLHDADLAYLSACSTARPGSKLPDEVIHLSSAFQLAGYRQVIGTLWPIADETAVCLAADLYDIIADDLSATAADALHAVTVRLRNQQPNIPTAWASHIHSGA